MRKEHNKRREGKLRTADGAKQNSSSSSSNNNNNSNNSNNKYTVEVDRDGRIEQYESTSKGTAEPTTTPQQQQHQ